MEAIALGTAPKATEADASMIASETFGLRLHQRKRLMVCLFVLNKIFFFLRYNCSSVRWPGKTVPRERR